MGDRLGVVRPAYNSAAQPHSPKPAYTAALNLFKVSNHFPLSHSFPSPVHFYRVLRHRTDH